MATPRPPLRGSATGRRARPAAHHGREARRYQRRRLLVAFALVTAVVLGLGAPATAELDLTRVEHLGFGGIVAGGLAGAVIVAPTGARSASGDAALGASQGARAARFVVTGDPAVSFAVVLPASATLADGGATMTVDTFTSLPAGSGQLSANGTAEVRVGATLRVGASQPTGDYSGTFDVTVVYE